MSWQKRNNSCTNTSLRETIKIYKRRSRNGCNQKGDFRVKVGIGYAALLKISNKGNSNVNLIGKLH